MQIGSFYVFTRSKPPKLKKLSTGSKNILMPLLKRLTAAFALFFFFAPSFNHLAVFGGW